MARFFVISDDQLLVSILTVRYVDIGIVEALKNSTELQ